VTGTFLAFRFAAMLVACVLAYGVLNLPSQIKNSVGVASRKTSPLKRFSEDRLT
jgi:hypothetical protein